MYGDKHHYYEVFQETMFLGQYIAGASQWQRTSRNEPHVSYRLMGRARVKDIFRGQTHSHMNRRITGTANEGDHVFLMAVRCKAENAVEKSLEEADRLALEKVDMDIPPEGLQLVPNNSIPDDYKISDYYWNLRFVTTHTGQAPPLHWYCNDSGTDDDYVGKCESVGTIGSVSGNRTADPHTTKLARRIIEGEEGHREMLNKLNFVEIHLGYLC
jgi:uncharacterized secreted protein with C-terminal beta-propeller domain